MLSIFIKLLIDCYSRIRDNQDFEPTFFSTVTQANRKNSYNFLSVDQYAQEKCLLLYRQTFAMITF